MYLFFIDESSTPPKPTTNKPKSYFVLAGIIVHEAQWHSIAKEFEQIKRKYNVNGEEIKWRFFGEHNADKNNPVHHLPTDKRNSLRDELYKIITERRSIKIIASVASVMACYKQSYIKDEEDLYNYTYKPLSERFQYFLQDMTRSIGASQLGIVIADHRGRHQDEILRKNHHSLLDQSKFNASTYDNYIETIFLTPSHHSVGIQLADLVAGAIGRKYIVGDDSFYKKIESSFRKSTSGKVDGYGIVKMPKTGWI